MRSVTPEAAARNLAVGRTVAGAGAWLLPRFSARMLGGSAATGTVLPLVLRLFGARDFAMGAAYLTAEPREQERWLAIGMAVDAADAVAALAAARRQTMPKRIALPVAATAIAAVAVAGWARSSRS